MIRGDDDGREALVSESGRVLAGDGAAGRFATRDGGRAAERVFDV